MQLAKEDDRGGGDGGDHGAGASEVFRKEFKPVVLAHSRRAKIQLAFDTGDASHGRPPPPHREVLLARLTRIAQVRGPSITWSKAKVRVRVRAKVGVRGGDM